MLRHCVTLSAALGAIAIAFMTSAADVANPQVSYRDGELSVHAERVGLVTLLERVAAESEFTIVWSTVPDLPPRTVDDTGVLADVLQRLLLGVDHAIEHRANEQTNGELDIQRLVILGEEGVAPNLASVEKPVSASPRAATKYPRLDPRARQLMRPVSARTRSVGEQLITTARASTVQVVRQPTRSGTATATQDADEDAPGQQQDLATLTKRAQESLKSLVDALDEAEASESSR